MNDEEVPTHGKADVAFAGAQLSDTWLLIGSIFVGMVAGSTLGWLAYVGVPVIGFALTKIYIQWKSENLPGFFAVWLYKIGITGYSSAFNRKKKLFVGDSKVINPSALQMGRIAHADIDESDEEQCVEVPKEPLELPVEGSVSELVS